MKKVILFLVVYTIMASSLNYPMSNHREMAFKHKNTPDTTLLSRIDFDSLDTYIRYNESRNWGKYEYLAENSFGFIGKYQCGADVLADQGLVKIKPKYVSNKKWLSDRRNWLGKLNCYSKSDFKRNVTAQEVVFLELTYRNYKYLWNNGIRDSIVKSDSLTWKGVLAACHLAGTSATINYIKNKSDFRDGYGTSIEKYIHLQ
jgi:hypothetical protein